MTLFEMKNPILTPMIDRWILQTAAKLPLNCRFLHGDQAMAQIHVEDQFILM